MDFLVAAANRQELPQIIEALSTDDRREALQAIEKIANYRLDLSAAVPRLRELTQDSNAETRGSASHSLSMHFLQARDFESLRALLESNDHEVKTGAIPAMIAAVQEGTGEKLLASADAMLEGGALNVRHDAAVAIGYAATNRWNVSGSIPGLVRLLSDEAPQARKIAAWALYRIAKYVGDISTALPALKILLKDPEEEIRELAQEAIDMAKTRP
jgi:HEAT repeat protein